MSWGLVAMIGVTMGCGRIDFDAFDRGSSSDAPRCEVTAGLIGYWPMNAGDVSASTVFDRSGAGLDGSMMGTPAAVLGAGRIGEALDFSGTTLSWVELPPIPFDATPGAFNTVAMWLRTDNPNLDESPIYLPYVFGPPRYDIWFTAQTLGPVSLCINDGENSCWGTTDPALIGRWIHLVAVFANGTLDQGSLFIDGAQVNSTCRFGPCDRLRGAQNPVMIGGPDARYGWHGLMDDLRIYNRALTPAEIQSLYTCY